MPHVPQQSDYSHFRYVDQSVDSGSPSTRRAVVNGQDGNVEA